MLTISGRKGNANQNHAKISLHSCRIASRTPPKTNVGEDTGKKEPSYSTGENVKQYNHFGRQYGGFFRNKQICYMIQQYHS
jgi:hypothetical protein